jgi:hypothetical protein
VRDATENVSNRIKVDDEKTIISIRSLSGEVGRKGRIVNTIVVLERMVTVVDLL